MEIKDIIQKENNKEPKLDYMPSSSEKKRVVMMYLFVGIMVYFSKNDNKLSVFEYYHFKQSSGWRILFLIVLVLNVIVSFVPIIRFLGGVLLLLFVIIWILFVRQAWNGLYINGSKLQFLDLFGGVGNWFMDLFEIKLKKIDVDNNIVNSGSESEIDKDLENS